MKRNIMSIILVLLLSGVGLAGSADPGEVKSDSADQEEIHLTIYNSNRALVTETRNLALPGGLTRLWFQDVAAKIMPQTVSIKSLSGTGFDVLEQNYEYDLLSPQKILEKYLDREVILVRQLMRDNSTVETRTKATLLSTNSGTVWKIGESIVVNPPYTFLEFPELPGNLYSKPTLVWLLDSKRGKTAVEASYLTGDISWNADYVFTLSDTDTNGDINGWVTIHNNSGTSYRNAKLKLIAGDVHVVEMQGKKDYRMLEKAAMAPTSAQFEEKSFFEYHMYTLQRPATVNDRQQKQIELLNAESIGVEKQFILKGQNWYYFQRTPANQTQKVEVAVRIENSEKNGLGMPLPKGTVRVYKKDTDGSSQFIGEDMIDHTPKDEKFFLTLGNAFDVVADRRQTEYRVISNCVHESEFEIKIRNHKTEPITVRVIEPLGGDWEMLTHTHAYDKTDAFSAEFKVPVKPDEEAVLTYRVRVKYPWGC